MAEPSSVFTKQTKQYIERVAPWAKEAADQLGVPAMAILGAVANEYDTRFNPDLTFDIRGGFGQAFGDWTASGKSQEKLSKDYADRESGRSGISKLWHPAKIDVGPGNVRIETAIDLLRGYLASHKSDGKDPLELRQYENNYPKLVDDLLDFNQPKATMAFAGLMAAKADAFFKDKSAAAWNRLSDDEQDALRVTYYKLGPETLSKNIDARIAKAEKDGADFGYNPHGDGGAQHLRNVEAIRQALERGLAGVDHGGAPAPKPQGFNDHNPQKTADAVRSNQKSVDAAGVPAARDVSLSPADILRLKKAIMVTRDPADGELAAKGIVDTILNRLSSGRWGDSVRDVVNHDGQFPAINGKASRGGGQHNVDQLSTDDPRFADASKLVDEHLVSRAAGAPSIIGNDLGYVIPDYMGDWQARLSMTTQAR